jgi:GT2 family glycosyltransferase
MSLAAYAHDGPTLAVLMTCHNRRETSLACLRALFASEIPSDMRLKPYLVDDGSTDGTSEAVLDAFPLVKIIRGSGNLYWNNGMRLAYAAALDEGHDYYLWLNDDTILLPHGIKHLLECYEDVASDHGPRCIVVGATQDPQTGTLTYGGLRRESRWHPLRLGRLPIREVPTPCDTFNGNCVLIPASVAAVVGNLDASFSHSLGDIDYGFRAHKSGCALWVAPKYVGTCPRNSWRGTWADPTLSLRERWRAIRHPKGLPPREWKVMLRRHAGRLWPLYLPIPYVKLLLQSMLPPRLRGLRADTNERLST